MNYRQKQKSLLIDPSNMLTFNVSHESIHMKKVKTLSVSNTRNEGVNERQSGTDSTATVNTKIYYSVVQKESESGISFNDRLFFLKDQDVFGYMSKPDKNFDIKNAKETVLIKCLRKVTPKGKTLSLEFQVPSPKQSSKLIQKRWVLRMKDKKMADAWTDIINYQVQLIPSRKSTIERHDSMQKQHSQNTDRKYELQTAQKTSNYFSKVEEPIANERPEQDYVSEIRRSSREMQTPRSVAAESKEILESPVREEYSNSSNEKVEQSPERLASNTESKQQNQDFNSTSEKHSLKKQRYMSSRVQLPYQPQQFAVQKSYYQQLQQSFLKKNQGMRQKLILPSFYNYFRPCLDEMSKKRPSARLEVDKKYEDFITYCELTAKQLIEKNDAPLGEFRLSNRFLAQKDSLPKDKLFKEMAQKYEDIFGKSVPKSMEIEALFLLFQNILQLDLEDVQIIIPLSELKTLPNSSQFSLQSHTSINKICENSLITEFQNKEKNLQYIYSQIIKHDILKQTFLIPMSCEIEFKGFNIFFKTKINETLFKAATVYDSSKEISYIANGNTQKESSEMTLDLVYEQLAKALFVNSELLESQNHIRIKPIRIKNQYDKLPTNNHRDFKYVISYADILPCLESKQVLDYSVFIKVHQNGKVIFSKSLKSQESQQTSKKISLQIEEASFLPSVLQQKSQSILKKKQGGKLPYFNQLGTVKQNDIQLRLYKEEINSKIKEVARKLDRFDALIIHPYELNQLLKASSLSHLYLGKIYQEISGKNSFIKSLIKSEIAAECAKLVMFKKCQQLLLTAKDSQQKQRQSDEISMRNVTTLLNLILGKSQTKQTELIWKVLTLHSQLLYSVSISQKEIHKGYFILTLASKLNIMINPNSSSIEDVFNQDKFIIAIKFQSCKIKPVQLISSFLKDIQETQTQKLLQNKDFYFKKLNQTLSISSNPLPYYVKRSKVIYNKILFLITQKISPNNMNFSHLNIYQQKQLNFTQTAGTFQLIEQPRSQETATSLIKQKQQSLKRQSWEDSFCMYYRRKLKQLQYKVVERNSFSLEQQIDLLMKEVKVFYEHHPIMSEFLQFLADYFVSKGEYQKAIDCLKASVSNIISVCEGNSNHVKLASCFLKIAGVYEKMRKFDDALNQLKRSKHCLQINKEDSSPTCAYILLKIAKITLQIDGKVNEALSYVFAAQKILELESNMYSNIQMLIETYEIESKCLYSSELDLNSLKSSQSLDRSTRSQHYFETLERILIKENQLNKANNRTNHQVELISPERLNRIFKLVLPYYFGGVSEKGGQMLMTYMCELSQSIAKKGGIDFIKPQPVSLDAQTIEPNQANPQPPQFFFYPTSSHRSSVPQDAPNQPIPQKQPKPKYNYHQAFAYIKKQIYTGQFIMQLMQFMQKSEEILTIIRKKVKQNIMSKSQSRSSSRMYLMSTKGADQWDVELNAQGSKRNSRASEQAQREEDIDLERLLDYSKEIRSSGDREIGYSQRERKFDSLMKALMVLLGDGFMLHIFQQ